MEKAPAEEIIRKVRARISRSPDARSEFGKKAVLWLLDKSEGMTKAVALVFPESLIEIGIQASFSLHDMNSGNCKTKLNIFLESFGISWWFSTHCGQFSQSGRHGDDGVTLWLAEKLYSRDAEFTIVDQQVIEEIERIQI